MSAEELLNAFEVEAKKLPLGHEIKHRGCSTYNWKMAILAELRDMLYSSPALTLSSQPQKGE